jgi:hypothetical protein
MIIDMDIEAMNMNYTKGLTLGDAMFAISVRETGKSYYTKVLKNRIYGTNLCKEIMLPMNPVQKPKYQFSRAKWYEVQISFDKVKWTERIEWCEQNFGPEPRDPDAWSRWYHDGYTRIKFRDAQDYEWFMLRWS